MFFMAKHFLDTSENANTFMGVIKYQLLYFFVTKPEVSFLTKNDYHCAKVVRNQYFIKKLEVLFLDENYNKSTTEGRNQCLLKKIKVNFFYQKGQKSTVHFFASTKFYRRFHNFSQFVYQKYMARN